MSSKPSDLTCPRQGSGCLPDLVCFQNVLPRGLVSPSIQTLQASSRLPSQPRIECTKKLLLHCPKLLQTRSFAPSGHQRSVPTLPGLDNAPDGLPRTPVPSSLFSA